MTLQSTITVEVKWQKEVYKAVEIDTSQTPAVFKMQLYSLTGVAPERQKIMGFKGGLLKDDADWAKLAPKQGQKVTMMGTADAIPQAPTEQTFIEDLPESEQDITGLSRYGAGLENLGNTCYMNSTIQCLYAVPELRSSLASYQNTSSADPTGSLTAAARSLFSQLEKSAQAVSPDDVVASLRRVYPQFDQRSREGYHMQQDAEECWGALLLALRQQLKTGDGSSSEIQRLFGVRTHATLKCDETGETMELNEVESMIKCNISGDVNHLTEGIKLGLQGDREKTSAALGQLAVFRGEAELTALPPYLTVQMVRFFYKADVQQKAKILRKVTFPLILDVFEFCSEELKEELREPRIAYKALDDIAVGLAKKKQKLDGTSEEEKKGDQEKEKEKDGGVADMETTTDTAVADAADDTSKCAGALTGRYELIGVLTHKGRSADSGHYVSWVKQSDGQWIQFDDDTMIVRKEEEVLGLSGGGDWHMAYLLLYKAQKVPGS